MKAISSQQEAAQALESTLLRHMLQASGAFAGGQESGDKIRSDMFVETLADAVVKSGGLGLAHLIEDSLPPTAAAPDKPKASPGGPAAKGDGRGFGPRVDPIDGTTRYHTGIDVAAPEGAPVAVMAGGVVRQAGPRGGYGNSVEVDHGGGLTTLYAHASKLLVKPGEKVEQGQIVAQVGATGRATGPHLHFEVRLNNHPQNPQRALNAYGIRAEDTVAGRPRSPKKGDAP